MTFEQALEIVREEEVGINNEKQRKISVYGSEGNYPHLHYRINGVEGCIRLDVPKYYCHESRHEGLNTDDKKWIIHWLMDNDWKNWKKCVAAWNFDSKQKPVNFDIKPNYKLLPNLQPSSGRLAKEDRV